MKFDKNVIVALIVIIVGLAVWIGVSVYLTNVKIELDTSVDGSVNPISSNIDTNPLESVNSRTKNLPITLDQFKSFEVSGTN